MICKDCEWKGECLWSGDHKAACSAAYEVRTLRARARELEAKLSRVVEWTRHYGKDLCPGTRADTYGEGTRDAKETVARMLVGREEE